MPILVKDTGSEGFQLPEPGMHNAVCSNVYDLGLQPGFQGKLQHKVVLFWELEERYTDGELAGKRMTISKTYTASLSALSNLRAHLESWRGRSFTETELNGFDLEVLRGVPCLLSIIHNASNGRTYANVSAVARHSKTYEAMKCELPKDFVPKWVATKLGDAAPDLDGVPTPAGGPGFEDDIPF